MMTQTLRYDDLPARRHPMYNYYVQEPMRHFWGGYGTRRRRVLFLGGLGFDPRCVPAISQAVDVFQDADEFVTFFARFTNLHDPHLDHNLTGTAECLRAIRAAVAANRAGDRFHYEVEVNLFDENFNQIGDDLLIKEFDDCLGSVVDTFTDIIVDASAFPRSMMYTLISHLWRNRAPKQNLFCVLTHTPTAVNVVEGNYVDASYVRGDQHVRKIGPQIWLPIIGGNQERLSAIFDYLRPEDVFPIVPFPDSTARLGDALLTASRRSVFAEWGTPFENVMYASGSVPWDVFRKIVDFAEIHRKSRPDVTLVLSAMSGRTLSLGALLAALWCDLHLCHSQPTEYYMSDAARRVVSDECSEALVSQFWLAGEVYEGRSSNYADGANS